MWNLTLTKRMIVYTVTALCRRSKVMILRWTHSLIYLKLSLKFSPILSSPWDPGQGQHFFWIYLSFSAQNSTCIRLTGPTAMVDSLPLLPNDLWTCDPSWWTLGLHETSNAAGLPNQDTARPDVLNLTSWPLWKKKKETKKKLYCPTLAYSRYIRDA